MADLRPSHLDDLGLSAALRWYVSKLQERNPFKISLAISGTEQPIDDAAKIATFRIVQEAFNNVIKHASASIVHIELGFTEEGIRVIAKDDGCGFDPARLKVLQSSSRPSLGLEGMKERACSAWAGRSPFNQSPGRERSWRHSFRIISESEDQNDDQPVAGG